MYKVVNRILTKFCSASSVLISLKFYSNFQIVYQEFYNSNYFEIKNYHSTFNTFKILKILEVEKINIEFIKGK